MLDRGMANHVLSWKLKPDEKKIWMAQARQVPRVDLISRADIERAYLDHNEESQAYIEECHLLYLANRAELIVPFRDDPTEGRILFPFPKEQRTSGTYLPSTRIGKDSYVEEVIES